MTVPVGAYFLGKKSGKKSETTKTTVNKTITNNPQPAAKQEVTGSEEQRKRKLLAADMSAGTSTLSNTQTGSLY